MSRAVIISVLLLVFLAPFAKADTTVTVSRVDSLEQKIDGLEEKLRDTKSADSLIVGWVDRVEGHADRSLTTVGWGIGIMGALAALIAIFIGVAAAKYFQSSAQMKEDLKDEVETMKKGLEEEIDKMKANFSGRAKEILARIEEGTIKEARSSIDEVANQLKQVDFSKELSEEDRGKLEEYEKRLIELEKAGGTLTEEDYIKRGWRLVSKRLIDNALYSFNKAIELEDKSEKAWFGRGYCMGELGRYEDALNAYDRATSIKSNYSDAWSNKAGVFLKQRRPDEALEACNRAIEIRSNHRNAWYNRACAYALLKNEKEMLSSLRRAIELYGVYKKEAQEDEDFKDYWKNEEFIKLVGSDNDDKS